MSRTSVLRTTPTLEHATVEALLSQAASLNLQHREMQESTALAITCFEGYIHGNSLINDFEKEAALKVQELLEDVHRYLKASAKFEGDVLDALKTLRAE
ncbi:MAG TPA: hypothetical protein VLV86_23890 [Vicinamibacterales bacterium]|nr:hypothetical protein [Vicinamibacterales bacterium]